FPPQIVSYFSLFNPEPKSVISSVPDTMPPVSSNTPTPFSSYDCNPNHSPRSPSPVSPYHSLIIDTFIRESSMNTKTPSYLKDYVCNALQLTISVPFVSLVLSFSFTNVSPTDQAMLDPSWKDATRQELAAFELNKTWLADLFTESLTGPTRHSLLHKLGVSSPPT
uniref:Uncharacterized protein n=1 Tax=Solanum lycopersicum TaxID=4081 RepID=A0A3Q7EWP5_SOLLC